MKFNSTAGLELRTWILFFVGISIAVIFAVKGNPLNPWWTLVIGAFTCTAIIVSAVQAIAGGMTDAARKAVEEAQRDEARRHDSNVGPEGPNASTFSSSVGPSVSNLVWGLRRNHISPI